MAAMEGILSPKLQAAIENKKILVVGAGGIGCEVLKNLVMSGFRCMEIIDLDTIDVSNLNRQFLFHKQHVGKSKAIVARESALAFNPDVCIEAHHDSITSSKYDVNFFKSFRLVLNALDNRTARSHVNRMCLAADVPLIESGSSGYLGQVTVIKKGVTECYECQPKPPQKTFPGCTIRNTPSEPIHCIVWAKHLFNQLFGLADPDEDVSPDTADPEAVGEAGDSALKALENTDRVSTRTWAQACEYNPKKLFHKLFNDDVRYLLSMDRLWQKRRAPTPLVWESLPDEVPSCSSSKDDVGLEEQKIWSIAECAEIFGNTCEELRDRLSKMPPGEHLVWDKDDDACMNFVTTCANIRSHVFGIAQKSKFDVKSMAGNIIPAIATTNAIVAGIIVLQAFKILEDQMDRCRTVYLSRKPNPRKQVLVHDHLVKPNPKCYVCSVKPEVVLVVNVSDMTVKNLEEQVLKGSLSMVAPDVEIDDGKGTILISSEEGETEENNNKILGEFGIKDGTRLKCDDFLQNFELIVTVSHCDKLDDGEEFKVVGDLTELKPKEEKMEETKEKAIEEVTTVRDGSPEVTTIEDEDVMIVENDLDEVQEVAIVIKDRKRKNGANENAAEHPKKKKRTEENNPTICDEVIVL